MSSRGLHPVRLGLLLLALYGCHREAPEARPAPVPGSPTARPEILELLRQDLAAERHSADGGGRVWMVPEESSSRVTAGGRGHWTFVYEAGPLGVAVGGAVFLQVSPFWGWSTPQTTAPERPGYTILDRGPVGVELLPETLDRQLLAIRIAGRPLAAGERFRVRYGAGPREADVDRFAEPSSRFWFAVDGDGDGVRGLLDASPAVAVHAGPPARLVLILPTTARPGDPVRLHVSVVDAAGNAGPAFAGRIRLTSRPGLTLPESVTLGPADRGTATVALRAESPGLYTVAAEDARGLAGRSNPLLVSDRARPILWADLHGHSGLSDGTGTPESFFRYARDVAGLDVAALTDHDHWGMQPLALHPALWQEIAAQVRRSYEPGRFVTLLGYEWTSWLYGHRHVLYFGDEGVILSSVDPAIERPDQLWAHLRGRRAVTIAHHSAGGPIATDWSIPPDPELEPITEISSVHGQSEAPDAPYPIYSAVPGNFVRDALARGYHLGFIGSGDSHDGHPGLAHLGAPSGGLAAVLTADRTRDGVLGALRARHTYATNGPRILLQLRLGDHEMGDAVPASSRLRLRGLAVTEATIDRLEIVRSGAVVTTLPGRGETLAPIDVELEDLSSGEYVYLRVIQSDGGAAWSSPFFVE